jgi:hypothetical protein
MGEGRVDGGDGAACGWLCVCAGDIHFGEGPFAPLLPRCVERLLRTAAASSELDTQKQVAGWASLTCAALTALCMAWA